MPHSLRTERLLLRRWRTEDLEPFRRMNADPRVMEFMPSLLEPERSDAFAARIEQQFERLGYGLYAVEHIEDKNFIGYVGLSVPRFEAHFTPAVEIGWRLDALYWGQGLATEGARAVAELAFRDLGLAELVSFTVPANQRSIRVMEKLGMRRHFIGEFDHPGLPEGHPLRRHLLYQLKATER